MNPRPRKRRPLRPPGRGAIFHRRLKLAPHEAPPSRRGFVILQIDGLSHDTLRLAMRRRMTPYLRRLVQRDGFRLRPWTCGVPASTPFFQLGLLYGNNADVPGFRWWEKREDRLVAMQNPDDARAVEAEHAQGREGLLVDGASYCNIFTGGARHSFFTTAGQAQSSILGGLRRLDVLLLLFFYAIPLAMTLLYAAMEFFLEVFDHWSERLRGGKPGLKFSFPLMRAVGNVLFRELATLATTVSVHNGTPCIYVNFTGYDEVAHYRGHRSLVALWSLRGIDRKIREIHRAMLRCKHREYDLYVISDHGQTESVPFERVYGTTLHGYLAGEELSEHTPRWKPKDSRLAPERLGRYIGFLAELRILAHIFPGPLKWALKRFAARYETKLRDQAGPQAMLWAQEVVVLPGSSDYAHVWFKDLPPGANLGQIRDKHPHCLPALVEHRGVRCVAVRTRRGFGFLGGRGNRWHEDGVVRIEGHDPLDDVPQRDRLAVTVGRLLAMPRSGDLVVFGALTARGVLNFMLEYGGHGGLEPEEQRPFFLYPEGLTPPLRGIGNPAELYAYFRTYRAAGVPLSR